MNFKMENEKKEYVAPSMEIMNMSGECNLLSDSGIDIPVEIEADDNYTGEFN